MATKEISKIINKKFYPDIVKSGGLSNAINESLRKIGSKLQVTKYDDDLIVYVRIENKKRFSHVKLAANERKFSVDLWNEGVCYGGWWLNDLDQVSDFIMKFIELRFSVKEMKKMYPWFNSKKGEIHEKGAKYEAKHKSNELRNYLKNEKTEIIKYLFPCFKIAKEMKELKELFPFTSLNTLCFSLTTGYPFLVVGPQITVLKENHFRIRFDEKEVKEIFSVKDIRNYIKQNIKYYGNVRQGTAEYTE
jgi:hypothetical protein